MPDDTHPGERAPGSEPDTPTAAPAPDVAEVHVAGGPRSESLAVTGTSPGRPGHARAALDHRALRAALRLQPARARRTHLAAGLQAGLGALLALGLTHVSPWPALAGFVALGAMSTLYGRFDPLHARVRVVALVGALMVGAITVTSLTVLVTTGLVEPLLVVGVVAGVTTAVFLLMGIGAPGATIIVFGAGASLGAVTDLGTVGQRALASAAGAVLSLVIVVVTDRMRPRDLVPAPSPAAVPAPVPATAPTEAGGRAVAAAGLRVLVGASAAGLLAHAGGAQHAAWAAIGAAAVLQGSHPRLHVARAFQRAIGTAGGAVVAVGLLWLDLDVWPTIVVVALLQVVTEVTIGRSYALGQLTITPMALLVTELAAPSGGDGMPFERVLDTLVGVALGVLATVLLRSRAQHTHAAGDPPGPGSREAGHDRP